MSETQPLTALDELLDLDDWVEGPCWPDDWQAPVEDNAELSFDGDEQAEADELSPERLMRLHADIYAQLPSVHHALWNGDGGAWPAQESADAWLIGPLQAAAEHLQQQAQASRSLVAQTVPALRSLQAVQDSFSQGDRTLVRGLPRLASLCTGRARAFLMSLFLGLRQVPYQWNKEAFVALLPERFSADVAALQGQAQAYWIVLCSDTHVQAEVRALARTVCAHFGWTATAADAAVHTAAPQAREAEAQLHSSVRAVCQRRITTHGEQSGVCALLIQAPTLAQAIDSVMGEDRSTLQSLLSFAADIGEPEWQDAKAFLVSLYLAAGHTPSTRNRKKLPGALPRHWHWALSAHLGQAKAYWLNARTSQRNKPVTQTLARTVCKHFGWT